MTRHIPISEFKDRASEFVAAAEAGEDIILTRHGKPTARLTAIDDASQSTRARAAMARLLVRREHLRKQGCTATTEEWIAWKNEGRP